MSKTESGTEKAPGNMPSHYQHPRRWKSFVWGFVILFSGMIIGAGISLYAGHAMLFQAIHSENKMAEHITRRIAWKVDLTPEQRKQVEIIVRARVAGFREIIDAVYPQVEGQFELLHQEVKSLLTAEQKVKWEKHYKKMKGNLDRHWPGSWNSGNIVEHKR
ncbi:MAG: hypothetical protein AB1847_17440 [bacterium]